MPGDTPPPNTSPSTTPTARDLIQAAIAAATDDEQWEYVAEMHRRGTADVLARARRLCVGPNPKERMLGADIVGQLGVPKRTFPHECSAILIGMLRDDELPEVLQSVGVAIGHLRDPKAIAPLAKFADHPDARVRDGVVAGLIGHTDAVAIATLIKLSSDLDRDVRDWATFGVALETEVDSEAVRDALYHRLCDPEEKIRHQAMLGLAKRKDKIVRKIIHKELRRSTVIPMALEAAGELGDPKLYHSLEKIAAREITDPLIVGLLNAALERCAPK